ncbi:MAG: hypothetical protein K0M45_09705 [Candidatus Paracaedibacteraceae bacterium]|nr:hypothetical protein [Candidatus Paracaedibacteraceae bacterium]
MELPAHAGAGDQTSVVEAAENKYFPTMRFSAHLTPQVQQYLDKLNATLSIRELTPLGEEREIGKLNIKTSEVNEQGRWSINEGFFLDLDHKECQIHVYLSVGDKEYRFKGNR